MSPVPEAKKPPAEGLPDERPRSEPDCPFCGSQEADVISLFGTQTITLQYRCRSCGTIFEAIKYD